MPVETRIYNLNNGRWAGGRQEYSGTGGANPNTHAEQLAWRDDRTGANTYLLTQNGFPCTDGWRGATGCHDFFRNQSINRTIIIRVDADQAGYGAGHGNPAVPCAIVYVNGALPNFVFPNNGALPNNIPDIWGVA